jgi:hypothetical protein
VSIVLMAITIVATMSAVALAIDIGMLLNARTEAQRAADASALAGAAALITDPDDPAPAEALAIDYGFRNTVTDIPVVVLPEDVDVDLARARVTVTVRRIGARGTAVPTWFANVFGVSEVDVEARAAAEVVPTGAARCLKPFAIPDAFDDQNGDGIFDPGLDSYVPADHGYGSDWRNFGSLGADGLNYENDFGRPMNVKQGGPSDPPQPGWYYPWDIPQADGSPAVGGDKYRWNIANCNPSIITIGDEYMIENGNMLGPTNQGVEALIAQDPEAYWDTNSNTVENSAWGNAWESSPRVGIVPVFDPARPFDPGKQPIVFTNFIAMFFEGVVGTGQDQEVQVRIMYAFGVPGGDESAAGKMVILVE